MVANEGNQLGSAYITVAPNAKGFTAKLKSEIKDAPDSIDLAVKEMPGKGAAAVLARAQQLAKEKPLEVPVDVKTGPIRGALDRLRLSALQAGQRSGHGFIAGMRESLGGSEGLGSVASMLTKVGAGAAIGGGFLKIAHLGYEQSEAIMEAKASMTAFTGSAQQAQSYIDAMNKGLEGTHASVKDVANSVAVAVGTGMRSAGDVTQYTKDIANLGAAMGNNFKEAGILMDKFKAEQTISAQGVREMEQWKIPIAAWAEKATGLSHQAFMKMVSNGQFAFQDLQNILRHNTGALAEEQAKTFSGAMASIKAKFSNLGAMALTPILQKAADIMNQYLVPGVQKFTDLMQRFGQSKGFQEFKQHLGDIASSLAAMIRGLVAATAAMRPFIGWVASAIWQGFIGVLRQIAGIFHGLGTMFSHAGTGMKTLGVAVGVFALRGRIAATVMSMLGRAMMMTPWLRIPMMAMAAGTAIMGFASKSRYVQTASHAVSAGLSKMCGWMGLELPANASMSQKAMAILGKVFDTTCSFMTMVVKVAANEIKKAFQNIVNACIHAWNAIKHVYNGVVRMANIIPGVHLGTANMTETVRHTYANSDDYFKQQADEEKARDANYNKQFNAEANKKPSDRVAEAQASGGGGGSSFPGDYTDGNYKLHGTGGNSEGAGRGSGGSGGGGGRSGRGSGSPVDRLAAAHAGTQALINRTQHLIQQEQEWEKTHNGMKNPQLMKQLVQALSDLKKALDLESTLKKQGNSHAANIEAQSKQKGGDKGNKLSEEGKKFADQAKQLGTDVINDNFEGTPFSNPLEWKNVKALTGILNGAGNGMSQMFNSLRNPMGGNGQSGTGTGGSSIFHGSTGQAGAQLSTRQATQASAAKSFDIKSGTPKQAPGGNDPFLQFGASGGGSGQGLLSGLKDMTNLKNFISKDAMERFQNPGGGPKGENGVAGQPKNGQTVNYNIHGANSHEVAQKVNRQHTINRAKVHTGRH